LQLVFYLKAVAAGGFGPQQQGRPPRLREAGLGENPVAGGIRETGSEAGRDGSVNGQPWRIGTEVYGDRDILPRDVISRKLSVPNAERIFFIRHALRAGFTIEEIFNLTKIDRWFLVQIKEMRLLRRNWRGRRIDTPLVAHLSLRNS
jgi:hypothetical protein